MAKGSARVAILMGSKNDWDVMKAAEQALQSRPLIRAYWQVLGIAQYRAGKPQAAVEALTRAMELGRGGDSSEWFFLAMAHWQLGDREQARKWYDQGVQGMDEHGRGAPERRSFRAEAEELLQIAETQPTTKAPGDNAGNTKSPPVSK